MVLLQLQVLQESSRTATGTGADGTAASATITRTAGSTTTIQVNLSITGSVFSNAGTPFPETMQLRRNGVLIKNFTGILGSFTAYNAGAGEPAEAECSFSGNFFDSNAGTGSTTYTVTTSNTAFSDSYQIIVTSVQA